MSSCFSTMVPAEVDSRVNRFYKVFMNLAEEYEMFLVSVYSTEKTSDSVNDRQMEALYYFLIKKLSPILSNSTSSSSSNKELPFCNEQHRVILLILLHSSTALWADEVTFAKAVLSSSEIITARSMVILPLFPSDAGEIVGIVASSRLDRYAQSPKRNNPMINGTVNKMEMLPEFVNMQMLLNIINILSSPIALPNEIISSANNNYNAGTVLFTPMNCVVWFSQLRNLLVPVYPWLSILIRMGLLSCSLTSR